MGPYLSLRWKLLIISSLVAALLSTGGMYLLAFVSVDYLTPSKVSLIFGAGLLLIPLVVTTLAFIFVYRHTARRRTLQALLSVLFSITLTLVALYAITIISDRSTPTRRWHVY